MSVRLTLNLSLKHRCLLPVFIIFTKDKRRSIVDIGDEFCLFSGVFTQHLQMRSICWKYFIESFILDVSTICGVEL